MQGKGLKSGTQTPHIKEESGKSKVWIRHHNLEEIWKDFKPEINEEYKTKIAIQLLDDEARQIKKQYKEKMNERENRSRSRKIWDNTKSDGGSDNNKDGENDAEAHDEVEEEREAREEKDEKGPKDTTSVNKTQKN